VKNLNLSHFKIVVVENNGARNTFLDELASHPNSTLNILYTENNRLVAEDKGNRELRDVHDCIHHHAVADDDFVVKMTGRYVLLDDSEFMKTIKHIDAGIADHDCVIKFGSYMNPVDHAVDDCITGLIGMRCRFMKQIQLSERREPVEWNYAKTARTIPEKVRMVDTLGIRICPGSNEYFDV
jgi:hypothetical protein